MLKIIHRTLFFTVPSLSHLSPTDRQQALQSLQASYQQRFTKVFQQQTRDLKSSFSAEQLEKLDLVHDQVLKMSTFEVLALRNSVQSSQKTEYDWPVFRRPNDITPEIKEILIPSIGPILSTHDLITKLSVLGAVIPEEVKQVEEVIVEKTTFNLVLTGFDPTTKVKFIKCVKDLLGYGLKESKDKVEEVAKGPVILFKGVSKESHGKIQAALMAAGGKVEFQ